MAANKEKAPYSVVSYFCGCGGLDLGFRGGFNYHNEDYPTLPFNILAAYDNEPRCIETYTDYFGKGHASVRACLKSFDKNGGVGDNRKKQAGAGENASISK